MNRSTTPTRHKVGLNLLYLVPGETGGSEIMARELISRLPAVTGEIDYVAFVNEDATAIAREFIPTEIDVVPVSVSGRGRARRVLAEQVALPRLAKRHGVDLIHSLASTGPAFPRVTSVVTVLDVIYAIEPDAHTIANRIGMSLLVPIAGRSADRVITISQSAAIDISRVLRIPASRIDVTHLAARRPAAPKAESRLREEYGLGEAPIVLSVSARRPHKNLAKLVRAFARIKCNPLPVLVLPGYPSIQDGELERLARTLGVEDRVRFLGWVSDHDLEGLYSAATCFVFASLAEGFGLPVLEALARGLPVACSNTSSMPEVAGDAALYFDPHDVAAVSSAVSRLLGDDRLRRELADKGIARAREFSWERTARETVDSYRRAWASSKRR